VFVIDSIEPVFEGMPPIPPIPMMMPNLDELPIVELGPPILGGQEVGPPTDYVEEKVNLNGDTVRKEVHTENGVTSVHV